MKKLITCLTLSVALAGCQTTALKINSEADVSANSQLSKVNKEALLESENIKLPSNYDVNAFTKMSIAAYVDRISFEKNAKKTEIDNGIIAKLLENELARTKRYEVLTRNCDACNYETAFQAENTVEKGAIEQGEKLNPSFVLETSISLGSVIKNKSDHSEIVFRSLVTTKMVNPTTGQIIHSFEPIRHNMPAKNFFAVEGKYLGGFDYRKQNELQEAYKEAAQKAIQVLVNRSMDYYPVGGRVTDYAYGQFGINSGIAQGFATTQPVVIFMQRGNMAIPIASGEVTPGTENGSGVIWKWKEDSLAAADVRKKLDAMGEEFLKRNKIYAVSVGTPESWAF